MRTSRSVEGQRSNTSCPEDERRAAGLDESLMTQFTFLGELSL